MKSVNVEGKKVPITTVRELSKKGVMGRAWSKDGKPKRIEMNPSQPKGEKGNTLTHEVLHLISDRRKLGLSERQVETVITSLRSYFRRNRKAFRYFLGK